MRSFQTNPLFFLNVRKLYAYTGLSVIVLTTYIIKYKDYNLINNSLLQEIKNQNFELRQSMQSFQVSIIFSIISRIYFRIGCILHLKINTFDC